MEMRAVEVELGVRARVHARVTRHSEDGTEVSGGLDLSGGGATVLQVLDQLGLAQ